MRFALDFRAETPYKHSLLFINEEEKRMLCMNRVKPLRSPQPKNLDWVIFFSLIKFFFFFFQEQAAVYRLSVPALASARLLGLGSKHLRGAFLACSTWTQILLKSYRVFLECSLRTADVFPVVTSLPPKKLSGRASGHFYVLCSLHNFLNFIFNFKIANAGHLNQGHWIKKLFSPWSSVPYNIMLDTAGITFGVKIKSSTWLISEL